MEAEPVGSVHAVAGGGLFSSCVEATDLCFKDANVSLVLLLRVASRLPAYSSAEIPGWPNIGNEFRRLSVDNVEHMSAAGYRAALMLTPNCKLVVSDHQSASCEYRFGTFSREGGLRTWHNQESGSSPDAVVLYLTKTAELRL